MGVMEQLYSYLWWCTQTRLCIKQPVHECHKIEDEADSRNCYARYVERRCNMTHLNNDSRPCIMHSCRGTNCFHVICPYIANSPDIKVHLSVKPPIGCTDTSVCSATFCKHEHSLLSFLSFLWIVKTIAYESSIYIRKQFVYMYITNKTYSTT